MHSLAIDLDDVTHVLLHDGWHPVATASFRIDAYEFVQGTDSRGHLFVVHGGGAGGIASTGYAFKEMDGTVVAGPLTALLAVRRAG